MRTNAPSFASAVIRRREEGRQSDDAVRRGRSGRNSTGSGASRITSCLVSCGGTAHVIVVRDGCGDALLNARENASNSFTYCSRVGFRLDGMLTFLKKCMVTCFIYYTILD